MVWLLSFCNKKTNGVFVWRLLAWLLKPRSSRPGSVAERWLYLPGPLLRTVVRERTHGCQMAFPWCHRTTERSGSTEEEKAAAPETRHTGSMWNAAEQGHSKTCHTSPWCQACSVQPGLVLHVDNIGPEFSFCFWLTWSLFASGSNRAEFVDNNVVVWKRESAVTPFRQLQGRIHVWGRPPPQTPWLSPQTWPPEKNPKLTKEMKNKTQKPFLWFKKKDRFPH